MFGEKPSPNSVENLWNDFRKGWAQEIPLQFDKTFLQGNVESNCQTKMQQAEKLRAF